MLKKLSILIFFAYIFTACGSEIKIDTEYKNQIESWKENRVNNLQKPDSWLSLTGLFWLEPGENKFGIDKSNELVFPKGLPYMGTFTLNDTAVIFRQKEAGLITVDEEIRLEQILKSDLTGEPTLLKYASLTFYLIDRDGKMGIRVKDRESEVLKNFDGCLHNV